MLSGLRTIFFQTELEWPPVEICDFRIGNEVVRQLYNKLFEPEFEEYHYENLDLQVPKPTLSRQTETGQSVCQFGQRSITIEERRPDFEVARFQKVIQAVLKGLKDVTDEIDDYEVPPFFFQRCKIHCLAQPHNVSNSLELLAARVANVMVSIDPFERPPSFFGVRFRFGPAVVGQNEDDATSVNNFTSVRFETYSDDPSQVWMEAASTYPLMMDQPPSLEDTGRVVANIQESYEFLTIKCKAFLNQFDQADSKG